MINFNGNITEKRQVSIDNRGFRYGDALFETIKVVKRKILFWEDHYFRLMASMRILRMEIPMEFTMEFLENEILRTIISNNQENSSVKIRLFVYRKEGGLYGPENNDVEFIMVSDKLEEDLYSLNREDYEVDIYKDYFVSKGLLSTLKTNNKIINVVGSIYAKENELNNCLIMNTNKNVIEALNGNLFVLKDKVLKTPPIEDGCLKGVMRKQILEIAKSIPDIELKEESISPFELQKLDEMFITNVIRGIQPVTKYRKKEFGNDFSKHLISKLNAAISQD